MNKTTLITAASVAAIVSAAFADPIEGHPVLTAVHDNWTTNREHWTEGMSREDHIAWIDDLLAYATELKDTAPTNEVEGLMWMEPYLRLPARGFVSLGYDKAFADLGYYSSNYGAWYHGAPAMMEIGLEITGDATNFPAFTRVVRMLGTEQLESPSAFPAIANMVYENFNRNHFDFRPLRRYGTMDYGLITKAVVDRSLPYIRRYLRATGQNFVVKEDGVNLVQELVDELTAILNAPKMAGLKEFIAKVAPDFEWYDSEYCLTDEDVENIREAVYYGDRKFGPAETKILTFALGVDEYNKFVEDFNK